MLKAIENVNNIIAPKLLGVPVTDQALVDMMLIELDGSSNKAKLGANATLAVSMAVAKAGAQASNLNLYRYMGGVHAIT